MDMMCTKCGEAHPATEEFWYFRRGKPSTPCKECRKGYEREKYRSDPALAREQKREARAQRTDELREYERQRHVLDRENRCRQARESRRRNLERARAGERRRQGTLYARGRAVLDGWYAQGCTVCGAYIEGAMHAHHRAPEEKDASPSQLCQRSLAKMRDELDKCDPYCANHHGQLEHALRNGGRDKPYRELVAALREQWREFIFDQAEHMAARL